MSRVTVEHHGDAMAEDSASCQGSDRDDQPRASAGMAAPKLQRSAPAPRNWL